MAQANVKLTVDASQATTALRGVNNQTNTLQRSFGGLKSAIAGIGITVLARQAINTSANFEKLNVRLGLLTKASGTFARSQELAAQAQRTFGLSATEALEGITDITARLQPLGVSVDDIKTTFFGFNTAAKLAGASAIESSNAFRQLAQALGSGRLQGDEFRSISEQIPTILKPVADELGTTVGELKKFSSEGKITSAVVIRALKKIENEGGKSLAALLKNDPTQVFKNLSNETENLSRAFGDALAPAVLPVIRGITELTKKITDFINSGAGKVSLVFTGIAVAIKGITVITPLLIGQLSSMAISFQSAAINSAIASTGLKGLAASSFIAAGGITKTTIALHALKLALIKTGLGAVIVVLGTLAAKFIDNRNAAKEAAEATKQFNKQLGIIEDEGGEVAEVIKEITKKQKELNAERIRPATKRRLIEDIKELEIRKKILEGEKKRSEIERQNSKFNEQTIESMKSIRLLEEQINGKTLEQISLEDKILEIKGEFKKEDAEQLINLLKKEEGLKKQLDLIKKNKEESKKLKETFMDIGQSVEDGIVNNLADAVEGTKTLAEAAISVLNNLKRKLIEVAIQQAVSGIGGKIGKFLGKAFGVDGKAANGGRIGAGQSFLVGEKGPEIFTPSSSGMITANDKISLGSGGITNVITVNVDANSSDVTANDAEANQLGNQIAIAIQSELIKQKRAGGLLA